LNINNEYSMLVSSENISMEPDQYQLLVG